MYTPKTEPDPAYEDDNNEDAISSGEKPFRLSSHC